MTHDEANALIERIRADHAGWTMTEVIYYPAAPDRVYLHLRRTFLSKKVRHGAATVTARIEFPDEYDILHDLHLPAAHTPDDEMEEE